MAYSKEEAERIIHERVMNLMNVDMPAYMIVNYAVRYTNLVERLDPAYTPTEMIAFNYSENELAELVKKIDSSYSNNTAIQQYIMDYLKEQFPEASDEDLQVELRKMSNLLPVSTLRMNACENYKLCHYIASQRSNDRDPDSINKELSISPNMEIVYFKLCEGLDSGLPLRESVHNAGREIDKKINMEFQDIEYNPEKNEVDNLRVNCGDSAVQKYSDMKQAVINTAAAVLNVPQQIKAAIDSARKESIGDNQSAAFQEEIKYKKEKSEQEAEEINQQLLLIPDEPAEMTVRNNYGPRVSNDYQQYTENIKPGFLTGVFGFNPKKSGPLEQVEYQSSRYYDIRSKAKVVCFMAALLLAVIDFMCMNNVGFTYKGFLYTVSFIASLASVIINTRGQGFATSLTLLIIGVAVSLTATI